MTINSGIRLTEFAGRVKPPAVAGFFYPKDPAELEQLLHNLLKQARAKGPPPKALLVPHAGYIYSGAVAATAYAALAPIRSTIRRVVLLGPAHRVYVDGMAISSATHFATPLGTIPVDRGMQDKVSGLPGVRVMDEAFAQEHSLEVHLPFLQSVLESFTVLPVVVGDADPRAVATLLETVWGGEETLVVISTDLSHFHDYRTASRLDKQTAALIRDKEFSKLGPQQACGCRPVNGLLKLASEKNMNIEILDVRNSGDTAGNHNRVVGYGAFGVYPASPACMDIEAEQQRLLLSIAHDSIRHGLEHGKPLAVDVSRYPPQLQAARAVFVTLNLAGQLRGCIGNTEPVYPLLKAVAINAYNAAFADPRFNKLTAKEFSRVELDISVLTPKQEIQFDSDETLLDQMHPGIDGLVIMSGRHSATFLPSVWDKLPEPVQFLAQLKRKAGIPQNKVPERAWVYQSLAIHASGD